MTAHLARRLASEDLVEHCTERVDVGGGRVGLTAQLLGAGVIRSQKSIDRLRAIAGRVEQFGDAEIEELRLAGRVDENVRRFDVPMDHQMAMRVRDGITHAEKQ